MIYVAYYWEQVLWVNKDQEVIQELRIEIRLLSERVVDYSNFWGRENIIGLKKEKKVLIVISVKREILEELY